MNFRKVRNNRRSAPLLDMTPLIDVVFLLLIFFLITTTFIKRQESVVAVNLPTGAEQPVALDQDEQLSVYVDSQGSFTVSLNEGVLVVDVPRDQLRVELQTLYDTNPDLSIFLRGDREVAYGSIMDIWLLAREIGFERVNAVVQEPAPEPPAP